MYVLIIWGSTSGNLQPRSESSDYLLLLKYAATFPSSPQFLVVSVKDLYYGNFIMAMEYRQGFFVLAWTCRENWNSAILQSRYLRSIEFVNQMRGRCRLISRMPIGYHIMATNYINTRSFDIFCELHESRDIRRKLWNVLGILWFHLDSITFPNCKPSIYDLWLYDDIESDFTYLWRFIIFICFDCCKI